MITHKNIKHFDGRTFLHRLSINLKKKSIKIHLILNDDIKAHTHPWDFKSIILFGGYKETVKPMTEFNNYSYILKYRFLDVNVKQANEFHLIKLNTIFGIKIPCLTIGIYGEKKQLCSLCKELGYCKSKIK